MPRLCADMTCIEVTASGKWCRLHRPRTKSPRRSMSQRRVVLARSPRCAYCGRLAVEVDHIVPISAGGAVHDPDNLQALCLRCHQAKTASEK